MPRIAVQSANWKYRVRQVNLGIIGDSSFAGKSSGYFGNMREDNGAILGVTSEAYGILQNEDLMNAAREALDMRGMTDFEQKIIVAGQGEKFFAEFTFKNKQLANAVGDIFGFRLTLKNSFDRSMRAAFELGFLRLVCTNGMATLEKEFAVTQKHSARLNLNFLGKAIDNALSNGQDALAVFDEIARVTISDEQGVNILTHLENDGDISGKVREGIQTLWLAPIRQEDKARNLYNLYNAATDYLTHVVENERYEYANGLSQSLLYRFVNAARKPERLAKLLTKIVLDEVKVTI